jgi:transcription elongation factor Elf1
MNAPHQFACPVCGYDELAEQPWTEDGGGSQEICPQCGIQFGYDDAAGGDLTRREQTYAEWRARYRRDQR